MIKLDILSDPICPWCLIGKTSLDRALEQVPDHPFSIEWHPYQLNPDMPKAGVDRRAYLETKFNGKDGALDVYGQIDKHARSIGLEINFEGIKTTPNTIDAHRLIHWAGIEQRQTFAVAALFKAYFTEGRDIGSTEVLTEIAGEIGMEKEMVATLLASTADVKDIEARDAHARERGVTGVPTFILANQYVVGGAQSTEFWVDMIKEINAMPEEEAAGA